MRRISFLLLFLACDGKAKPTYRAGLDSGAGGETLARPTFTATALSARTVAESVIIRGTVSRSVPLVLVNDEPATSRDDYASFEHAALLPTLGDNTIVVRVTDGLRNDLCPPQSLTVTRLALGTLSIALNAPASTTQASVTLTGSVTSTHPVASVTAGGVGWRRTPSTGPAAVR